MNIPIFEELHEKGIIDENSLEKIKAFENNPAVSVHWDLKTLLYAGILMLTTGLGILIYKNIDSIGHLAIVIGIAVGSAACFGFCIKKSRGFRFTKVETKSVLPDYVLLLGCLLMLIFVGYIQFEYEVFGHRWGMATFFPMVVLFVSAYYFDHLGVLSMAIVNLAAWLGLTITPLHFWQSNNMSSDRIIYTGLFLGALLIGLQILTEVKKIKPHFAFTYKNFGTHILFISAISAMINFDHFYLLWLLLIIGLAAWYFITSIQLNSFYFLVFAALYFYFAISYVMLSKLIFTLLARDTTFVIYMALFYIILSCIGLVAFLMKYNKKLKTHDSI